MARRKYEPPKLGVYVLRFSTPLGSAKHSASRYVGSTTSLEGRLYYHRRGEGAAITRAAYERGIGMDVELFIPCATEGEARALEREIKAYHNTARWMKAYQRKQVAA